MIGSNDSEELLVDGAIDQTFAFTRSQYIPLSQAKIEQRDKLEQEIPSAEAFFIQAFSQI